MIMTVSGCGLVYYIADSLHPGYETKYWTRIQAAIVLRNKLEQSYYNSDKACFLISTGKKITIDGSSSFHVDEKTFTYYWYILNNNLATPTSNSNQSIKLKETDFFLSKRDSSKAELVLIPNQFDENQTYTINLITSDGSNVYETMTTFRIENTDISDSSNYGEEPLVNSNNLVANAGSCATININTEYIFDSSKSSHKKDKSFTRYWIQKSGPNLNIAWLPAYKPEQAGFQEKFSHKFTEPGNYNFELVCSDGEELSVSTVNITVSQ